MYAPMADIPLGKVWDSLPPGYDLGMVRAFRDLDYSSTTPGPKTKLSTDWIVAKLVQNNVGASGGSGSDGKLLPAETVFMDLGASQTKVDGLCDAASTGEDKIPAGVVDPYITSTGVANGSYFWLIIHGPAKVKQANTSAATVTVGMDLIPHATENGRVDLYGNTTALIQAIVPGATEANIETALETIVLQNRQRFAWALEDNNSVENATFRAFISSPRFWK